MDWKGFESLQEYVALRLDEFDMIPVERNDKADAAGVAQGRGRRM